MAGALLSAIVKQLGPFVSSEFALTASVDKEVQKLETKFRTIQAVLNDAEKRQLKEEAVKLWLDKLKCVSYETDDVLDEWNTAMIKEEIEKQQKEVEDADAETSTTKKRKVCVVGGVGRMDWDWRKRRRKLLYCNASSSTVGNSWLRKVKVTAGLPMYNSIE